jgi:excisionase family DNA binding protein
MSHDKDRLLRKDQAAEILTVSTKTVDRLGREGEIRTLKVRGGLRYWKSSVDDYLLRQEKIYQDDNAIIGTDLDK